VSLTELRTSIGVKGLYDILEIVHVDNHNQRILRKRWEAEQARLQGHQ
jgi:hypothetical protein